MEFPVPPGWVEEGSPLVAPWEMLHMPAQLLQQQHIPQLYIALHSAGCTVLQSGRGPRTLPGRKKGHIDPLHIEHLQLLPGGWADGLMG